MPASANNWTYPDALGVATVWPEASSYIGTLPDGVMGWLAAGSPSGLKFVQQFVDALLERCWVLGASAEAALIGVLRGSGSFEYSTGYVLALAEGDDVGLYTFVMTLQESVEAIYEQFLDRSQYSTFEDFGVDGEPPMLSTLPTGAPPGTRMNWRAHRGANFVGPGIEGPETYPGSNHNRVAAAGDIMGPWLFEELRERIEAMDWVLATQAILERMEAPASPFDYFDPIDSAVTFTGSGDYILNNSVNTGHSAEMVSPYATLLYDLELGVSGGTGEYYSTAAFETLQDDVGVEAVPTTAYAQNGSVSLSARVWATGVAVTYKDATATVTLTGSDHGYTWSSTHKSGVFGAETFEDQVQWDHWFHLKPSWKYGRTT